MSGPWPRSAVFGDQGLVLAGSPAASLARRFGTPLVVVDEDHLRERCRAFREAFDRVLWAVKALPVPGVIRVVLEEGLGLLAATGEELATCLRAGARGDRTVLHGNNKSDEEIHAAVAARVSLLVVDNEEELERVEDVAAERGTVQPVLLRLAPAIDVGSHAYVKTGAADTKFGIPLAEGMAHSALKRALELPHLAVRGVHLHLGSQLLDAGPFERAVDAGADFLAEAARALEFRAEVLDVGGGMGVRYVDEDPATPEEIGRAVGDRLRDACAARDLPVPELVVEPGRALSAGAAITLYRVGTIKEVPGVRTFVAVDGGMSDNIRPALYGAAYTVALASRPGAETTNPVTVVGRHCESGDVVARDVALPSDLRRGDLLAVAATGAYEYAMASSYNRVGRPAVVLVRAGHAREVARREDHVDVARLETGSPPPPEERPPEGVEIRPARPRDARGVRDHLAEVAAERRFIRTERVGGSVGDLRRRFRTSYTRARADLVAVAEGEVIGSLGVAREADEITGHVASLGMSVSAAWRGRGVGSALLAEALRWAEWAGVEKVSLTVYPGNERAIALYRKFGFAEEGRLTGHSKKSYGYEDEIVMGRWLSRTER